MIDLQDLQKLEICAQCRHVYTPKQKEFAKTRFSLNDIFCEACVSLEEEE